MVRVFIPLASAVLISGGVTGAQSPSTLGTGGYLRVPRSTAIGKQMLPEFAGTSGRFQTRFQCPNLFERARHVMLRTSK